MLLLEIRYNYYVQIYTVPRNPSIGLGKHFMYVKDPLSAVCYLIFSFFPFPVFLIGLRFCHLISKRHHWPNLSSQTGTCSFFKCNIKQSWECELTEIKCVQGCLSTSSVYRSDNEQVKVKKPRSIYHVVLIKWSWNKCRWLRRWNTRSREIHLQRI